MCLRILSFIFFLTILSCSQSNVVDEESSSTILHHDLSYIKFDPALDRKDFQVCDSTAIHSGRNMLEFKGGNDQLRKEIKTGFSLDGSSKSFNGYVMIRFIINCKSETGRFRAQALNPDFSPSAAKKDLEQKALKVVKDLDGWTKSLAYFPKEREYSKYINLKFINGEIDYVIL